MIMETSKSESLGATNSIELVIPGVWSIGGMMTNRRKNGKVFLLLCYQKIHRNCPHLMFSYLSYVRPTSLLFTQLMQWGVSQAYSRCDIRVHLCL
jgi:hypothetical protein